MTRAEMRFLRTAVGLILACAAASSLAQQVLDRPARRLQISVRFEGGLEASRSALEASGRIGNRGSDVQVRAQEAHSLREERIDQRVQALEGARAFIALGQSRPVMQRRRIQTPGGVVAQESFVMDDATTGFEVVPRLAGDRVFVEIASQNVATSASGRLGEWFELGTVGARQVWVKVEGYPTDGTRSLAPSPGTGRSPRRFPGSGCGRSSSRWRRRSRDAIERAGVLVAEAGTGTGKTFAYLVPALLAGGKVIVSTGTKTLQDQLFDRDLPRVREALGVGGRHGAAQGARELRLPATASTAAAERPGLRRATTRRTCADRAFCRPQRDRRSCATCADVPEDAPASGRTRLRRARTASGRSARTTTTASSCARAGMRSRPTWSS